MVYSFLSFLYRTFFLVSTCFFISAVPIESMDLELKNIDLCPNRQSIRTIEIFPKKDGVLTTNSTPSMLDEKQDSQYTYAFGRGRIFEVGHPNQWQQDAACCAMNFDSAIEKLGIGQNFIFVSLSIGLNAKVHHNVPHLFFSGNAEMVYDRVFINTTDILHRFSQKDEKQSVFSNNINSSVIRNTFLCDNTPSDYAEERTLEFIVKKHFPNMFYGLSHAGFFIFPIHQVILIDQPLLTETKSKKSKIGKNTTQTTQVNCSENEPDFLTCQFRDFIYGSFTKGKEEEIENHIKNEGLDLMLQILNNIITHAKDNSHSQAIPTTQRSIMRSVLAERYVRQNSYSANILKEIFDLTDFDDIFGKTGRESHESVDTMSVMSNCFLHSEQAYLKMMLQLHQINVTNFIISYIYERFNQINIGLSETIPVDLITIADKDSLDINLIDDTDLDIILIDDKDNKNKIINDDDEDKIVLETQKIEEKSLQFNFLEPIIIDIISPRHICKFCRGSLHLRCNDIQQLLGSNIVIDPMNEKILIESYKSDFDKLLDKDTQNYIMGKDSKSKSGINTKPSPNTHERLYPICKERRNEASEFSQFASNYEKFMLHKLLTENYPNFTKNGIFSIELKNVSMRIFATSFKDAKESIMGINK